MTRRASARRWIMGSLRSLKPPSRSAARRQHRREHGAPFSRRIALNETSHDHGRQRHAHDAGMVAGDAEQQDALRDAQRWGCGCRGLRRSLAHAADRARRGLKGKCLRPRAPGRLTDPAKNPRVGSMVLNLASIWETDPKSTQFAQFSSAANPIRGVPRGRWRKLYQPQGMAGRFGHALGAGLTTPAIYIMPGGLGSAIASIAGTTLGGQAGARPTRHRRGMC